MNARAVLFILSALMLAQSAAMAFQTYLLSRTIAEMRRDQYWHEVNESADRRLLDVCKRRIAELERK